MSGPCQKAKQVTKTSNKKKLGEQELPVTKPWRVGASSSGLFPELEKTSRTHLVLRL